MPPGPNNDRPPSRPRLCGVELLNAIISALDAHTAMSTQALNSPDVQRGLKDILLNHAALYERLRMSAGTATG